MDVLIKMIQITELKDLGFFVPYTTAVPQLNGI